MGMIAAVIVTYNRLDKLRNCIEAVMGQTVSEPVVVMVIDNNSTDGTGEWIITMTPVSQSSMQEERKYQTEA